MIPSSSTKKIIIILSFFILITGGVFYGVFYLIKQSVHKINVYEVQQQQVIAELESDKSLRTFLKNSGADLERLTTRVVPKDGTVAFLEMVERSARDNNLAIEVDLVNVSELSVDKQNFEQLNLSLATKGSWEGTYTFLSLLETLPYKIILNQVGLTEEGFESVPVDQKEKTVAKKVWNGAFSFSVIKYK